jgi:hypothetical protein
VLQKGDSELARAAHAEHGCNGKNQPPDPSSKELNHSASLSWPDDLTSTANKTCHLDLLRPQFPLEVCTPNTDPRARQKVITIRGNHRLDSGYGRVSLRAPTIASVLLVSCFITTLTPYAPRTTFSSPDSYKQYYYEVSSVMGAVMEIPAEWRHLPLESKECPRCKTQQYYFGSRADNKP